MVLPYRDIALPTRDGGKRTVRARNKDSDILLSRLDGWTWERIRFALGESMTPESARRCIRNCQRRYQAVVDSPLLDDDPLPSEKEG